MKWLYLSLELASLSLPVVFSVTPRFGLKKNYLALVVSIVIVAIPFILWDVYFTSIGIWGFNPKYHLGIAIFNLPLEEVFFFLSIPFACMFTYHNVQQYRFRLKVSNNTLDLLIAGLAVFLMIVGWGRWYSMSASVLSLALIAFNRFYPLHHQNYFYTAYLLLLIPFFLVNGTLTGMFTPEPVVWYNNLENTGLRLVSIPAEDFLYFFVMFGLTYRLYERYKKKPLD